MSFDGKVVLITGANSGIGAGAARHLSKLGAKVVLVDKNRSHALAEEIQKSGAPKPLLIVADVTTDAERIIKETINHFGKLDVLVNSAGILTRNSIENFDFALFDKVMDTNVRSIINLTRLAVPHLEATKGNVVNVSSLAGLRAIGGGSIYCISKAAVDQFTKCASLDLAPKGIRVNAINPGIVVTPILDAFQMSEDQKKVYYEHSKKQYPLGRLGAVEDTAAAIAYLASDSASFITGVLLPVDGGRYNVTSSV